MKVSKKILLTTAGFLIAILVTGLAVMRKDTQALLAKNGLATAYEEVPVEPFNGLSFTGKWIVKIRPGRESKVELAVEEGTLLKPELENVSGTLHFKADTTSAAGSVRAKITVPQLQLIRAGTGVQVEMGNFVLDSLHVILEDGSSFTGDQNQLKFSTFTTSGSARMEFTSPTM